MNHEIESDHWLEELAEIESDDTFRRDILGQIAELILLALMLSVLVSMVLLRRAN